MAKPAATSILRSLKPIRRKNGAPILRHDPGVLPSGSLLVRKPKAHGPALPGDRVKEATEVGYGQHIYMYHNIHTKQVVYSFTRQLNNHDSLRQLPFLGKKTQPPRLRKDLWLPFCLTYFPSPHAGQEAFRKLREYRRLHETRYDLDSITVKEGPHTGNLMTTKERGKVLMNQKANSIADLAAVLLQQEAGPDLRRVEHAQRKMRRVEKLRKQKGEDKVTENPVDIEKELTGVEGVKVLWADPLDAEYAEQWPEEITHDTLERHRYTAAFPPLEILPADDDTGRPKLI